MSQEIRKKYSPDSSTVMMRRSQTDMQPSDTIRYMRRKEEGEGRPAPPPYVGQAIPRVKPIRTFQKGTNNSVGENSRPTSRRFDTFGENALETIYDQFKFLDESEEAPSAAQTPTSVNSTRPIMAMNQKKRSRGNGRPMLYCVLPILELFAAIAILVVSFLTNRKELETRSPSPESSDLASEAMYTLSIQNALSTIIPCSFQILSAIFGFWPLFPTSKRRAAQILHIFFNSIVIFLWFNAIYDLFFKISMAHVLQKPTDSDEKYVIDLIYGCFLYFATVILPAITVCVATYHLATSLESRRIFRKSMTAMSVSLGTLLFSLATTVIAVFTAQASLAGDKTIPSSDNMLAYGLKESIIFVFVLLTSIFSLIIATQNRQSLMFPAIIGQGISILSITSELFTSDRISTIFNELKTFETSGSAGEIGIVLLNGCAVVSLILLLLQIIIFVFCVSTTHHGSEHSLILDNNRNPPGRHVERTAF